MASSYRVVGCLSVRIKANETIDGNHTAWTFSYYPTKQAYFMISSLVCDMVLDSATNKIMSFLCIFGFLVVLLCHFSVVDNRSLEYVCSCSTIDIYYMRLRILCFVVWYILLELVLMVGFRFFLDSNHNIIPNSIENTTKTQMKMPHMSSSIGFITCFVSRRKIY